MSASSAYAADHQPWPRRASGNAATAALATVKPPKYARKSRRESTAPPKRQVAARTNARPVWQWTTFTFPLGVEGDHALLSSGTEDPGAPSLARRTCA